MWWRWKCKPLSWLWGMIPLALLGLMAIYSERSAIEKDLEQRSIEALQEKGMDWAQPTFRGRDGVIFGKALSADEKLIAMDTLRGVEGVRIVKDDSSFSRPVSPYLWSAEKKGRRLILSGYVPSLEMRDEIVREAKTRFPRLFVSSSMQIAPGEPERVDWKQALLFALEQIRNIKRGSVHIEDRRFTVKGDALNSKTYARLDNNIQDDLPAGVRLQENLVIPPVQDPFVWKAEKEEGRITLTGFVPNNKTKLRIRKMVQRKFPKLDVDDQTRLGSGEPSGWENMLRVALNELASLKRGEAKISNKKVYFKGLAPTKQIAEQVKERLSTILPGGFSAVEDLDWVKDNSRQRDRFTDEDSRANLDRRDSDRRSNDNDFGFDNRGNDTRSAMDDGLVVDKDPEVKTISPYSWSATLRGKTLIIGGYVLSEEMRDDVMRQARRYFPRFEIVDSMKIGAGGLGREKHMMVTHYAFQRLATLAYGTFSLRDDKVRLSGEARRNAFKPEDLDHSLLPPGVTLANARIRPAKVKNYGWEVRRKGNQIILSGYVPDKEMHQSVLEKAKSLYPSLDVVDKMKEASGQPDGLNWKEAIFFSLKQVDGLKNGRVGLMNRGYHLVGTAWSHEDQKKLELAKAYIPTGFNLEYQRIQLPTIKPYIWRIDFQAGRVTLSGNVPNEDTKQRLIVATEERFPGAAVIDQLEIAAGKPRGWKDNINAGIDAVSRLKRGSVTLIGRDMTVRGVASNDYVKKEVAQELRRSLSRSIRLVNKVRVEKVAVEDENTPDYDLYEKRKQDYMRVTEEELDSDKAVKASTCERYLNTLVSRTSIRFAPASAKLGKDSYKLLDRLAFVANRCEQAVIEIAGHTDSDGTKKFNHFLSFKRARSVADFLASRGISKDRLVAVGYGETRPIAPNNSRANKAKNRRIEFVVKERF